ncbi:MAG: septum formation initiator family protein [Bacilli bacterium]
MKKKKASNNRLMLFGTISVLIIIVFFFNFATYILQVNNLDKEQKNIEKKLLGLKEKESYLKTEIIKLKDSDYLARFARENYMYSKNGEYLIKVNEEKTVEKIAEKNSKNTMYIISTIIIFSLFGIIFVIKKIF